MAIKGANLSLILYFVNKPKENIPSNGPYVYPATVNNDLITLSSLIKLKIIITINKTKDISRWTYFLVLICLFGSCLWNSIISTQNDVVKEVRAESALEYAAAIIPIIKRIPTKTGSPVLRAILGNNISGLFGTVKPNWLE